MFWPYCRFFSFAYCRASSTDTVQIQKNHKIKWNRIFLLYWSKIGKLAAPLTVGKKNNYAVITIKTLKWLHVQLTNSILSIALAIIISQIVLSWLTNTFISLYFASTVSLPPDLSRAGRGSSFHPLLRGLQPAGISLRPRGRMHRRLATLRGTTVISFMLFKVAPQTHLKSCWNSIYSQLLLLLCFWFVRVGVRSGRGGLVCVSVDFLFGLLMLQ